jgi:hypothetical protein
MGHACSQPQIDASVHATTQKPLDADAAESSKPKRPAPTLNHGPSGRAWRRAHEKMKEDEALWCSLPFDGIQHDGIGGLIENRCCPCCGSTLNRRTTALHAVQVVATLSGIHSRSLDAIVDAGAAAQRVES